MRPSSMKEMRETGMLRGFLNDFLRCIEKVKGKEPIR